VEFPYLVGVEGRRYRSAQALANLAGVGQAGADSFAENLPFELREDRQQGRHGSTRGRGQVQCLGQRNETDSEMLQFLKSRQQVRNGPAPAVQPPYQHHVDFAAARGLQQLLSLLPLGSTRTNFFDL